MIQRTFGIIKPDATKRNLIGEIITDLQNSNLKLVGMKMVKLDKETAEHFYKEHSNKVFFDELITFMTSNDIVVFALEGEDAITEYRKLLGNTDPLIAEKGTLRAKYALKKAENSLHGSDSPEAAKRELDMFGL